MIAPTASGASPSPAFLPLRRAGSSSGFGLALREQIRAEIAGTIGEGFAGGSEGGGAAARSAALQQALLLRGARTPVLSAPAGPWADLTRSIGEQYLPAGDADIFTRQMQLESGNFDPDVIAGRRLSSAGAEGIAQLMPSSYPDVNRRDPVASLHAAAQTMRTNLQRFGGDMRKALAAYNAGVGTVQDAVTRAGTAWETLLPAETQLYLRTLLGG